MNARSPLLPTFTPQLQLQTLFVLSDRGRIVSTREPNPTPGPKFCLVRDRTESAWAVHATVPEQLAIEIEDLARAEPPARQLENEPVHAARYVALIQGRIDSGPVFTFPEDLPRSMDIAAVTRLEELQHGFHGWTADELPGCSPILGIFEGRDAVSVCFCARRSDVAAEAGVNTAERFRGRGLGVRVTAAWASAVRSTGLLPLYSTSWTNKPSLAIARKLGLLACASDWSIWE